MSTDELKSAPGGEHLDVGVLMTRLSSGQMFTPGEFIHLRQCSACFAQLECAAELLRYIRETDATHISHRDWLTTEVRGAYLLGELSEGRARQVKSAVSTCRVCQLELRTLQDAVDCGMFLEGDGEAGLDAVLWSPEESLSIELVLARARRVAADEVPGSCQVVNMTDVAGVNGPARGGCEDRPPSLGMQPDVHISTPHVWENLHVWLDQVWVSLQGEVSRLLSPAGRAAWAGMMAVILIGVGLHRFQQQSPGELPSLETRPTAPDSGVIPPATASRLSVGPGGQTRAVTSHERPPAVTMQIFIERYLPDRGWTAVRLEPGMMLDPSERFYFMLEAQGGERLTLREESPRGQRQTLAIFPLEPTEPLLEIEFPTRRDGPAVYFPDAPAGGILEGLWCYEAELTELDPGPGGTSDGRATPGDSRRSGAKSGMKERQLLPAVRLCLRYAGGGQ